MIVRSILGLLEIASIKFQCLRKLQSSPSSRHLGLSEMARFYEIPRPRTILQTFQVSKISVTRSRRRYRHRSLRFYDRICRGIVRANESRPEHVS